MAELTNFERVKIQREYVVPLIKDLQALLGEDTINDALKRRARDSEVSIDSGKQPDFSRMTDGAKMFAEGGALDYDIIASGDDHFDMDVKRCQYAEMMDELGGREFGHFLVCNRDFVAAKRIGMTLTRTQTIMRGADYCDFRYRPARTS